MAASESRLLDFLYDSSNILTPRDYLRSEARARSTMSQRSSRQRPQNLFSPSRSSSQSATTYETVRLLHTSRPLYSSSYHKTHRSLPDVSANILSSRRDPSVDRMSARQAKIESASTTSSPLSSGYHSVPSGRMSQTSVIDLNSQQKFPALNSHRSPRSKATNKSKSITELSPTITHISARDMQLVESLRSKRRFSHSMAVLSNQIAKETTPDVAEPATVPPEVARENSSESLMERKSRVPNPSVQRTPSMERLNRRRMEIANNVEKKLENLRARHDKALKQIEEQRQRISEAIVSRHPASDHPPSSLATQNHSNCKTCQARQERSLKLLESDRKTLNLSTIRRRSPGGVRKPLKSSPMLIDRMSSPIVLDHQPLLNNDDDISDEVDDTKVENKIELEIVKESEQEAPEPTSSQLQQDYDALNTLLHTDAEEKASLKNALQETTSEMNAEAEDKPSSDIMRDIKIQPDDEIPLKEEETITENQVEQTEPPVPKQTMWSQWILTYPTYDNAVVKFVDSIIEESLEQTAEEEMERVSSTLADTAIKTMVEELGTTSTVADVLVEEANAYLQEFVLPGVCESVTEEYKHRCIDDEVNLFVAECFELALSNMD